jgi:nucleotide-binding universal stress UspA family protein
MRRVLVSLDGTDLAASVLPDARRLAGPCGTLILIRTAGSDEDLDTCRDYLTNVVGQMEPDGTEVHPLAPSDPAVAIDHAVLRFRADMVALATRGRDLAGIWQHGSVAWRAALRSTVPVLLRHSGADAAGPARSDRRILIPLDGSVMAERAVSLARDLADEWGASILLVRIVAQNDPMVDESGDTVSEAERYLRSLAQTLGGDVQTEVRSGLVVESIAAICRDRQITDIVMTTHGRTGLTQVLIGGVAEEMVHRLGCPIIVIPALVGLAPLPTEEARRPRRRASPPKVILGPRP